MKTSKKGIDLIKKFEGCKLNAYKAVPTEKYWTIGYGHYGADVKPGMAISAAQAEAYLIADLEKFEKAVNKINLKLSQNQFDALVSFTYNCGSGNLNKLVLGRTISQIADAILLYNKSGGKVLNGLVKRREAERTLFLEGSSQTLITIAHASIDENRCGKNGKAGDQTGKEVCIRTWYNKPWTCVIRFHDPDMREKCAIAMSNAVKNDHIGYDQNQRNTLLEAVRKLGYDPKNATKDVETDCSALVTLACIYAGIAESALVVGGNSATTRNLKQRLKATGEVTVFTTKDYTADTDKLLRGDILLAEGSHVAVVESGNLIDNSDRSIEDVARAVLRGDYGDGSVRRAKLTEEGFNYAVVQSKVNELKKRNMAD